MIIGSYQARISVDLSYQPGISANPFSAALFLLSHIYTDDIRGVINKHYIPRVMSVVKICVRIKSAVA